MGRRMRENEWIRAACHGAMITAVVLVLVSLVVKYLDTLGR